MLERALINAWLGDGHFWKHPESKNYNLVFTSIHQPWLAWKAANMIVGPFRITKVREANASGCFPNSKALYQLKTHANPVITEGYEWSLSWVLRSIDMLDLAIWYLDDGCCVRRKDTKSSFRVSISVGALTGDELLPHMRSLLGTNDVGRVYRNNSRATENNQSWIIPKPAAIQILNQARKIAPKCLQYKVPLW